MQTFPYLGFGLGLRPAYYQDLLTDQFLVDWLEIMTEDFLVLGGNNLFYLDQVVEKYPVAMHGVSLSIGSSDPIDLSYLSQVKKLAKRIKPAWISDHLCWTGINKINSHDLLPLPYTQEALTHIVNRVKQVQDFLDQPIMLENVSSYVEFKNSELTEWDFLSEIAQQSGCFILLDINNIYVSGFNHGFDPHTYIDAIPKEKVKQFHLAGHSNYQTHIVDTHDNEIIPPVWELYRYALNKFGKVTTMIERDDNIPPLSELLIELNHARKIANESEN